MLLWGHRLVIPLKFCEELLIELHSTHLGTNPVSYGAAENLVRLLKFF